MSLFPGAAFARRATALHNLVLVEQVFGHGTNRGKLEKTLFLKYQCRSFPCNFVYKNQIHSFISMPKFNDLTRPVYTIMPSALQVHLPQNALEVNWRRN